MTVLVVVPLLAVTRLTRFLGRQEQRMQLDPVTGLLNRRGLTTYVNRPPGAVRPPSPHGAGRFALLLVSIGGLGSIGETLGRGIRDELLVLTGAGSWPPSTAAAW